MTTNSSTPPARLGPASPSEFARMLKSVQDYYYENPASTKVNVLVMGESGSGKSFSFAKYAPRPVFIDSFDKGTAIGLRDFITKGEVLVDTRWEAEDPTAPTMFEKWKAETLKRIKSGFFNYVGTYILDGATTWSAAIMNDILRKAGRAGQKPSWGDDYVPQKVEIRNWLSKLLLIPCHFVLTGHLELIGDGENKLNMRYRFMSTGKASVEIPLLFDEQWVTVTKESPKGTDYNILTQPSGLYIARSRLAQDGKLNKTEPNNFREILKKAGYPHEDKPLFMRAQEEEQKGG